MLPLKNTTSMGSNFQGVVGIGSTGGGCFSTPGTLKGAKAITYIFPKIEMGMVEIARVMEDSTFVFENYRDELLKLGVDYGQSFETSSQDSIKMGGHNQGYNVADSLEA